MKASPAVKEQQPSVLNVLPHEEGRSILGKKFVEVRGLISSERMRWSFCVHIGK